MQLESLPSEMLDTILAAGPRATFAALAQLNHAWHVRMAPRLTRELEHGLKYHAYREKDWFDGLNWWGRYTYGSVSYKGIYVHLHAGSCYSVDDNTTYPANGDVYCRRDASKDLANPDTRIDLFRCDIGVINISAFNDILLTWKHMTAEQFIKLANDAKDSYYRDSIGSDPIFMPSDLDPNEKKQADEIHLDAITRVCDALEGEYTGTILAEPPFNGEYYSVHDVFFVDEYDGVCDELRRLDVIATRNGLDIKV